MKIKDFQITTTTKTCTYKFLTRASCGKTAIKNLITFSGDFNHILGGVESNNMIIKVKTI